MMDVFIYFPPEAEVPRDVIEDEINEALPGRAEVTGGGGGDRGSNLDVEVFEDNDFQAVAEIKRVLWKLKVPRSTYMMVDGKRQDVF